MTTTSQRLPFVGRQRELALFDQALRDPRGQVILIVGQQGLGKTTLLDKLKSVADKHPELHCGAVRYEVTKNNSAAATMGEIIDDAFDAAQLEPGSFDGTPQRVKQWKALIGAILSYLPNEVERKAKAVVDLVGSLRRDPHKDTRKQFRDRLELISERMPESGRALFFVDPEKYMQDGSADDWRLVFKDLPDKIKFIFAQRPDDMLITNHDFMGEIKPLRIPDHALEVLDEQAVADLIQARASDVRVPIAELRRELRRYKGHPYAIQGAIDLVASGLPLDRLPADPTDTHVAAAQWERLRELGGADAVRLFEAYAVLEVAVPDSVVESVAELTHADRVALRAKPFVTNLLRDEAGSRRIYHSLLANHIREQLSETDAKHYHQRAIAVYRKRLHADLRPDTLAATRLPEHVLAADGPHAFPRAFADECTPPLQSLGLLDTAIDFSLRAMAMRPMRAADEAALSGNLGLIYKTRGDLDGAETLLHRTLAIAENLNQGYLAAGAQNNLGLIYKSRGDLDKAENMYRLALANFEQLGQLEGVATALGNLAVIYKMRGEFDLATLALCDSVAIVEKLDRPARAAIAYSNLAGIYMAQKELDQAEALLQKAVSIDERLGRLEGLACDYGNLGVIHMTRGNLEEAEAWHRKALAIDEKLGRLEGVADEYYNLGSIAERRGDRETARKHRTKARDVYAKIGMPNMVQKVQSALDALPPE